MDPKLSETQRRRLKRGRGAWPKWLRSKHLIRWLFYLGPLIYRIARLARMIFGPEDG